MNFIIIANKIKYSYSYDKWSLPVHSTNNQKISLLKRNENITQHFYYSLADVNAVTIFFKEIKKIFNGLHLKQAEFQIKINSPLSPYIERR